MKCIGLHSRSNRQINRLVELWAGIVRVDDWEHVNFDRHFGGTVVLLAAAIGWKLEDLPGWAGVSPRECSPGHRAELSDKNLARMAEW